MYHGSKRYLTLVFFSHLNLYIADSNLTCFNMLPICFFANCNLENFYLDDALLVFI